MKIAVLLGGTSAERDVSITSGIAIAKALRENGHSVQAIDCAYGDKILDFMGSPIGHVIQITPSEIDREKITLNRNIFTTVDFLIRERFDVVFNALHGGYGENGQLQTMLDLAHIPYTGSGSLASALGMDKNLSKILFRSHLAATADWETVTKNKEINREKIEALSLPLVIKPNWEGSSVGISIVEDLKELPEALSTAFQYSEMVLVEKYISGREVTVSILGDRALPIVEIIPQSGFYDYQTKYQKGKSRYVTPAELPKKLALKIQEEALQVFGILGCRGYARADFRLRDDQQFFCLEVNTLPGMTATSLVPKAAKAVGLDFNSLVERIVELALV